MKPIHRPQPLDTAAAQPLAPSEAVVQGWVAQSALFAPRVSRRALLGMAGFAPPLAQRRVNVWRNHAFEPLQPLLAPYFGFGRWAADFSIGPYDDGLGFAGRQPADAELLWLDRSRVRLTGSEFVAWLQDRLAALRALTVAPLLLASWGQGDAETNAIARMTASLPGVAFADLAQAAADEGAPLHDTRSAVLAGTPLSAAAQLLLARRLACHWLPALLLPPVKAIALDLDHTLHAGVLGEDGIDGVQLTPAHAALQSYARTLRQRGIFLALVSRNEAADVRALFERRSDYPLRWSDFSVAEVSWGPKHEALSRVAAALNIAPDALLFVDDNSGELAQVAQALPHTGAVLALPDAAQTQAAVSHWPGLWRWKVGADDGRRVADLQQAGERQRLAGAASDPAELLRQLQVRLTVRIDPQEQLARLAELCGKTNQFNTALARLPEAELARCMGGGDDAVAAVELADRLADSGNVAVLVARRSGSSLRIRELCVSCRAMGRGLEDSLVLPALQQLLQRWPDCDRVVFELRHAPRNQPARRWLAALLGAEGQDLAEGTHDWPAATLRRWRAPDAVTITVERTADATA